jgi:polyhydroxyalkanoate synthase subunit PhaC
MHEPANDTTAWWNDLLSGLRAAAASGADDPQAGWQWFGHQWMAMQQQGIEQMSSWWRAPGLAGEAAADRRFADSAWHKDGRFAALAHGYLTQAQALDATLRAAPMDERSIRQWRFVLRQVVDAASPANCLATNPEAMQQAIDSGGASLMVGLRLFMEDLAKGRVTMTDESAFEVGRNVATSAGSVVFENELMQLIQLAPTTAKVRERALLIVPPCINKYYVLDLQPENSLVAYAVGQGHAVFLVSWRNPGAEQGHLGWDDYVAEGVLRAIDVARAISRADRINTLGFCIGGTLLACALAVAAAAGEQPAASLTLLTTMLDFHDTGEIGLLVTEAMVAAREATIGRSGLLQGSELAQVFAALRANDLIWPYVVNGYLKGKAPPAFDLLYWNSDATNLPGPMACWYLRNAYLENRLRVPGGTVQCGVPVDLGRVDVPAFLYASREDHIVPWTTAYASTRLLGGPVRFVLGASGHIAGVINPPAKRKRNHWVARQLPSDPEQWLAQAESVEGSWWPAWAAWLDEHAGASHAAPKRAGNTHYPVIEPAPGRYVKTKA